MHNLILIGLPASGKTSAGRALARRLDIPFYDCDEAIEAAQGQSISAIFSQRGEAFFRDAESRMLEELCRRERCVIATGGGAVLRPENRAILAERGYVVYLQVTADEAASRISDVSTRPLFRDLDTARATIEARLPLYEDVADAVVDTSGKSVAAIAREVRGVLEREGILWQRK